VAIGELTPGQRAFLDHFLASELAESFYLSGGTALAGWPETEPPTTLEEARGYFRRVVGGLARSSI
jgi:hypothetical protein